MFGAAEFGMDTDELVTRTLPTTPLAPGAPAGGSVEVKVAPAGQAAPQAAPVVAVPKPFLTTPMLVGLAAVGLFFLARR